jgi:hypothetical protein
MKPEFQVCSALANLSIYSAKKSKDRQEKRLDKWTFEMRCLKPSSKCSNSLPRKPCPGENNNEQQNRAKQQPKRTRVATPDLQHYANIHR